MKTKPDSVKRSVADELLSEKPRTAREAMELYYRFLKEEPEPDQPIRRSRREPLRSDSAAGEILQSVLNGPLNSKAKTARIDSVIEGYLIDAAKGDLSAAEALIDLYNHSKKNGDFEPSVQIQYVDPPIKKG